MAKSNWGERAFSIETETGQSRTILVTGRTRWALECLVKAGTKGCTPIRTPGPRWSAYVHELRHEYAVNIETITEPHAGPFPGTHARYVLRDAVTPLSGGDSA